MLGASLPRVSWAPQTLPRPGTGPRRPERSALWELAFKKKRPPLKKETCVKNVGFPVGFPVGFRVGFVVGVPSSNQNYRGHPQKQTHTKKETTSKVSC